MRDCPHPPDQLTNLFPARDYITGRQFEIACCHGCGLTITTPQPGPGEISDYYPPGYYGTPAARRFPSVFEKLQRMLYVKRAKWVEKYNGGRPGHVLDVGCGRGLLLKEFQNRGWEVVGTELSDQAASYPRQVLNLPVRIGSLEQLDLPANQFDAAVMWHVLEHVPEPRATLAAVNRVLKPGGIFMVGVPNFGGWEARFSRDKWFHLDVPRHLNHFTRESLRHLLRDTGFREVESSGLAPEYDSFSFVQSVLNRLGLRQNLLYELFRRKGAKVISGDRVSSWQVCLTLLLSVPLGILSVPFTTVAGLVHQAGTTTVLAVKERPDS